MYLKLIIISFLTFILNFSRAQTTDILLRSITTLENAKLLVTVYDGENFDKNLNIDTIIKQDFVIKTPSYLNYSKGKIIVIDTFENQRIAWIPFVVDPEMNQILFSAIDSIQQPNSTDNVDYSNSLSNKLNAEWESKKSNLILEYLASDSSKGYIPNSLIYSCYPFILSTLKNSNVTNNFKIQYLTDIFNQDKSFLDIKENMILYLETFKSISPEFIKNDPKSQALENMIQKKINYNDIYKIGKKVPIFKASKADGSSFTNESLKGQPYILAFSASWCGPCMQSLPKLKALHNKYKSKGLQVVYFSLDTNKEKWLTMIHDKNINSWINVSELLETNMIETTKMFNIRGIPNYFLIDESGKIIYDDKQLDDLSFEYLEVFIKKIKM
ncbi:TlpA family protein disulfide reductase [Sphingobacterium sp. xlx-130]|uniref:TlpA family protein disulfide reductase n=1 Tax=Sphingobacterium sp. xlx-130 TaxID=2654323 RepID=UPI0013DBFC9C|nr:TlpA disulfide reductase family protein [Sphingobacterium sp. xlx-130]